MPDSSPDWCLRFILGSSRQTIGLERLCLHEVSSQYVFRLYPESTRKGFGWSVLCRYAGTFSLAVAGYLQTNLLCTHAESDGTVSILDRSGSSRSLTSLDGVPHTGGLKCRLRKSVPVGCRHLSPILTLE